MRPLPLIALGLMLLAATPAGGAVAQPPGYGESIAAAKGLMLAGRRDEARTLLQQLATRYPDSNDVQFLLGLLALDAAEHDRAIAHFRSILVRSPDAVRVRLELGRAFFLKRDYENAFRQFQFARAGNLPAGVGASIDRFVAAIRQQKDWSYSFSIALAPDSNINNGTSTGETLIFGLPFELSEDSRQRSGIGLAVDASAEFAPRVGERTRLRVGAAVQRREHKGEDFDDMTLAVHAGPRIVAGRWDLSLLGSGFRRSFGGRTLSQGLGARGEATRHIGPRSAASFGLSAHRLRYPDYRFQDGWALSASAGALTALTPASTLSARASVSRKSARLAELASWSGSLAAGYYRDLPGGFSLYAEPSFGIARYDAEDPFFFTRRKDKSLELRLALLNRRIVLSRFTPRIGLTLARRDSNIDIYDFSQRRVEVGLTSAF
ncbi:MAG TPA: surface lipoprotein assembly modifier [Sphingomicrobium sp.]|nr:surface lipoprotein assembly modifier [Sphingomicrobium sp.]